ncbi:MAG TPA: HAD-IC family P-type ATPase [Thermoplasmata archaeon]
MTEGGKPGGGGKWFALSVNEVLQALGTTHAGLSSDEAKRRLAEHGPNELPREKPKSSLHYLSKQVNQPLIYVLMVSAAVTAYLAEWIDTVVIVAVIAVNALIGFFQERKAGEAIQDLLKYEVASAKVKRDGHLQTISAPGLVPGDLVALQSGDMIPADLRFTLAKDLFTDESLLTGESQGVLKHTGTIHKENPVPADQTNMGFSGTFVIRGRGEGVVVATGMDMEIGKISQEISEVKEEAFPLMKKVAKFSRYLSIAIALAAVFTFVLGIAQEYEATYMFRASVALAVAAIPEGLPAMLTVAMAMGVRAMARRNAIVRSLPAVEALGSTTTICSDKTGTLTMNRMTVVRGFVGRREYEADAPIYRCIRHCDYPGPVQPEHESDLVEALTIASLCNDATVKDGKYEGDPTETALLLAATSAGIQPKLRRLDEIPFETTLGYMATLNEADGGNLVMVKGAPERILPKCTSELVRGEVVAIEKARLNTELEAMAGMALRVLALARRRVPSTSIRLAKEDVDQLTFVGFVGMIDPPRPEAKGAIDACRTAEIRVMMITGDHKATAKAIGSELGIEGVSKRVVTGEELEALSASEFDRAIAEVNVFARVTPEHKYRIVKRLRERGEIVAVTGDGVNDTPALKAGNIGVAMGLSGTDAAKAAADIVLRDDNFATIVAAVEEGRDVYSKLQKIIAWTIPTNISEAMMLFIAILLGAVLPLLPLQILWINLVTAIALAIPLVFEVREPGLMQRPPVPPNQPIINAVMGRRFILAAAMMIIGTYGIFNRYVDGGASMELSRTVAMNTLVLFEMFYLLNSRSLTESVLSTGLLSNRWIPVGIVMTVAFQLSVTYLPALNTAFETTGMAMIDWATAVAIASTVFFVIELEKWLSKTAQRTKGTRART